jgi:hypothetical protein
MAGSDHLDDHSDDRPGDRFKLGVERSEEFNRAVSESLPRYFLFGLLGAACLFFSAAIGVGLGLGTTALA